MYFILMWLLANEKPELREAGYVYTRVLIVLTIVILTLGYFYGGK